MVLLSWVKPLPLVNHATPAYITGISGQDDLTLSAKYPKAFG